MAGLQSTCSIAGCDGRNNARRLCLRHYAQARREGTLPEKARVPNNGECTVSGCTSPAACRQMCSMHYQRMRATGTTQAREVPKGAASAGWVAGEAAYRTVHSRLVAQHGPASSHSCTDCGRPAREWSYDHSDPEAKNDARCGDYSVDLDRYDPRCAQCHRIFDHQPA